MGDKMSEKEVIQNATLHIIRPQKWQMAFWGLVILIGGIAIGSAATLLVAGRGHRVPGPGMDASAQRMVQGMTRELALTPDQQRQIEPLIRQHMARLAEIRSKAQPQITEQFKLMHDEIARVLTPEQLKLWEERFRRIPEDFRPPMSLPGERFRGPGPRPMPGVPAPQGPQQRPEGPMRPSGPEQQPQQPPVGPQPGAVRYDQQRMEEDRVAAAVFAERAAQQDAAASSDSQPMQDQQNAPAPGPSDGQPQDDFMPPPPPDDAGGPPDGGTPPPDGGPMGPPPDQP
jgi:hypothetical protein